MKKTLLFLSILLVVAVACDLSVNVAPPTGVVPTNTTIGNLESPTSIPASPTSAPATSLPAATDTALQPSVEGVAVSVWPLSLVLPQGLTSGVSSEELPRDDAPGAPELGWTPGHSQIQLEGYLLQGKAHQPRIYVYPAQAYAEMLPAAFESMHRLNNVLGGLTTDSEQLPAIPFFNAQQVFAAHIQLVSFQNGHGVRFLTEYAQYPMSANNSELFYEFQGFTSDGTYYIVAVFPLTVPVLAETSDGGAALPPGGIPYPYFAEGSEADMQSYYTTVTDLLNATSPQAFSPTIDQLDRLIQSMRVTAQ